MNLNKITLKFNEIDKEFCDYEDCNRREICPYEKISIKIHGISINRKNKDYYGNPITTNWVCPHYK